MRWKEKSMEQELTQGEEGETGFLKNKHHSAKDMGTYSERGGENVLKTGLV